jgi:hypothetical protein
LENKSSDREGMDKTDVTNYIISMDVGRAREAVKWTDGNRPNMKGWLVKGGQEHSTAQHRTSAPGSTTSGFLCVYIMSHGMEVYAHQKNPMCAHKSRNS